MLNYLDLSGCQILMNTTYEVDYSEYIPQTTIKGSVIVEGSGSFGLERPLTAQQKQKHRQKFSEKQKSDFLKRELEAFNGELGAILEQYQPPVHDLQIDLDQHQKNYIQEKRIAFLKQKIEAHNRSLHPTVILKSNPSLQPNSGAEPSSSASAYWCNLL